MGVRKKTITMNQPRSTLPQIGASKERVAWPNADAVVDSEWELVVAEAKRTAPTSIGRSKYVEKARRKQRDAEIAGADEYELPTEEKVVLLVSRSLNDRKSLPGHVYRCLVREYRARAGARRRKRDGKERSVGTDKDGRGCSRHRVDSAPPSLPQCRDTHLVLNFVTEILLEARPGFGSSSRLVERMGAAVEALVFGELYDEVFEEIIEETRRSDETLMKKVAAYEMKNMRRYSRGGDSPSQCARKIQGEDISIEALEALLRLPEARAPLDKLSYCVSFVESLSSHYCGHNEVPGGVSEVCCADVKEFRGRTMDADSLLRMVCEHIIVAKVPHLNAELLFIEEFARNEHMLKGKEGYALVTLQSSLHLLNSCSDIEHDFMIHN